MSNNSKSPWSDVLNYWFGDDPAIIHPEKAKMWFSKNDQIDREIADTFGSLIEEALQDGLADWEIDPRPRLAKILLLDQFTRNVFRGTPKAFAGDPIALKLALHTIDLGEDQQLTPIERSFCYLPLEHSEDLKIQNQSVALFQKLKADGASVDPTTFNSNHIYAVKHQVIIAKFGRFPHRNGVLGRVSTPEEESFLNQPGSSF